MEHENYQRQLELLLARLGGRRPRLLLRLLRKRVQKRRLSLWRRWRLSPWESLRRCS